LCVQELLAYKFFPTIEKLVPLAPYDSDPSIPSRSGHEDVATPLAFTPMQSHITPTPSTHFTPISIPPRSTLTSTLPVFAQPPLPRAALVFTHSAELEAAGSQHSGPHRALLEALFDMAEEATKLRHKSDEANAPDKPAVSVEQQRRKVRSQDDLLGLLK
jgi:hypothetical protein